MDWTPKTTALGPTRTILTAAVLIVGCGPELEEAATVGIVDDDSGSEGATGTSADEIGDDQGETTTTTTGDGDTTTTGDGDTTTTTTGDGDTTTTTTGDGDTTTTGDGDTTTTGDGDTTTTTTGDGDTTTTTDGGNDMCAQAVSFEIGADQAVAYPGMVLVESDFGEGWVLAVQEGVNQAMATFEIDIPCDDTWHIWVRGIEYDEDDSYWIRVDGQPQDWAIFELDCNPGPYQTHYLWKEINYRSVNAPLCQYLYDPWTQDWMAGVHTIDLGWRESWAIARLWVTNTNQSPP